MKNAWSYTPIPPYFFMAWCLIKDKDDFTQAMTQLQFLVQKRFLFWLI